MEILSALFQTCPLTSKAFVEISLNATEEYLALNILGLSLTGLIFQKENYISKYIDISPIETIVKRFYIGSDKHNYYNLNKYNNRFGIPMTNDKFEYNKLLVRFDYRNPNINPDSQNSKNSFIMKFIFVDQIIDLDSYIYDNQNNIQKYSILIPFFDIIKSDPENQQILTKFFTILDLGLGTFIKKDIIFFL